MRKPLFVELILPQDKLPTHDLAGYNICSDYVSHDGRHIFLRRPETINPVVRKERKKVAKNAERPKEREKVTAATPQKSQTGFAEQDLA